MLKLLFIEDEPQAVESAIDKLNKNDCDCKVEGFDNVDAAIDDFLPDVVILDILEAGVTPEPDPVGIGSYDLIWDKRFCPIIVYSAHPELLSEARKEHPFVRFVQKGRTSVQELERSVDALRPHAQSVREAETKVRGAFSRALRDVAPYAFREFDDEKQRDNVILRSAQRRLAALMDDLSRHGDSEERLAPWEHYICPPVCDDLQLGDILKETNVQSDNPASYRIILSPSCDLVATGGRTPKIENVLVAQCCSMQDALGRVNLSLGKKALADEKLLDDYKDKLKSTILTQGYHKTVLPFPQLRGRIPTMAADLRNLDFVPISDIGESEKPFRRIASIDSPFRELVAWAYMQIACRPGLPDRDYNAWCDEIVELHKNKT